MRKLILIIIIIFISNPIFSQGGIIKYEVHLGIDLNTVDKKFIDFFTQLIDYGNNQQYELVFNEDESCFRYIDNLSSNPDFDKNTELIARTFLNSSSDVYIDYKSKKVIMKKPNGLLVENEFDTSNWEITTESKTIGNYLSYKAIKRDSYIGAKGEFRTLEVIAWFAPSLPYKYGPISYFGLPGLILELTFPKNKSTFVATKIELEKKDVKINFPKGKTITKDEYEKKMKAQMGM